MEAPISTPEDVPFLGCNSWLGWNESICSLFLGFVTCSILWNCKEFLPLYANIDYSRLCHLPTESRQLQSVKDH